MSEDAAPAPPTDLETARAAVAPYRDMTPAERFEAFAELLREMDALLDGKEPVRHPDDEEFWRHWKDPCLGRRR